jgi:hypothetical protein
VPVAGQDEEKLVTDAPRAKPAPVPFSIPAIEIEFADIDRAVPCCTNTVSPLDTLNVATLVNVPDNMSPLFTIRSAPP